MQLFFRSVYVEAHGAVGVKIADPNQASTACKEGEVAATTDGEKDRVSSANGRDKVDVKDEKERENGEETEEDIAQQASHTTQYSNAKNKRFLVVLAEMGMTTAILFANSILCLYNKVLGAWVADPSVINSGGVVFRLCVLFDTWLIALLHCGLFLLTLWFVSLRFSYQPNHSETIIARKRNSTYI